MEEWEIVIPFKTNQETKAYVCSRIRQEKSVSEISDVLKNQGKQQE